MSGKVHAANVEHFNNYLVFPVKKKLKVFLSMKPCLSRSARFLRLNWSFRWWTYGKETKKR